MQSSNCPRTHYQGFVRLRYPGQQMDAAMKFKFRMYRRGRIYYVEDNETGQQESLKTSDKTTAVRLLNAKNEASILVGSNLQVARAYMVATDPHMPKRTWKEVVDFIIDQKTGPNKHRWVSVSKDKSLVLLWKLHVVETRADQLLLMMSKGTVSTNVFLRRLHNFAIDMNWLAWPILPKKLWPRVVYAEKRGITAEEHEKIIARETNPERRDYYDVLWYTGGSQTDVANLHAEDINWKDRTIFYRRKKSGSDAMPRFGDKLATVLARCPRSGPLFPYLITVREKDRATEFKQRCNGLGIKGITLHSYRYGWAERAAEAGYPERHAQSNLGHGSKAVARAYAKRAKVKTPSLEEYEEIQRNAGDKVIPLPQDIDIEGQRLQAAHHPGAVANV
jgi:integrase